MKAKRPFPFLEFKKFWYFILRGQEEDTSISSIWLFFFWPNIVFMIEEVEKVNDLEK